MVSHIDIPACNEKVLPQAVEGPVRTRPASPRDPSPSFLTLPTSCAVSRLYAVIQWALASSQTQDEVRWVTHSILDIPFLSTIRYELVQLQFLLFFLQYIRFVLLE